jgi:hypothetical protein
VFQLYPNNQISFFNHVLSVDARCTTWAEPNSEGVSGSQYFTVVIATLGLSKEAIVLFMHFLCNFSAGFLAESFRFDGCEFFRVLEA